MMYDDVDKFWISIKNKHSGLYQKAFEVIVPFASTYLSELSFSILLLIKNGKWPYIKNIDNEMRIALSTIEPDFNLICAQKQPHRSH